MTGYDYWGRCYLWEVSLFIGISGLVLALYGAIAGVSGQINGVFAPAVVLVLLVPALGQHTPFFSSGYFFTRRAFDKFRGWSKFTFPAIALS